MTSSLAPGGLAQRRYTPGLGTNMQSMQDPSMGQPQSNAMQMEQVNPGAPQAMGVQGPGPMTHPAPQLMMAPPGMSTPRTSTPRTSTPGMSTPGTPNRQNRRTTPMGA